MNSTLQERINRLLAEHFDGNKSAMSRAAGVSKGAVTQWTDGTAVTISADAADALEDRTGYSSRWIRNGKPPERVERNVDFQPLSLPEQAIRRIPVVGNTQAGPPERGWLEAGYPPGEGFAELMMSIVDKNAYALRVVGSSMAPRVLEGDFVVLAPNVEPRPGCDVVVRTVSGDVMLKRFDARRGDEIVLSSVNEAFERRVVQAVDVEFMHRVAAYVPADMIGAVADTRGS